MDMPQCLSIHLLDFHIVFHLLAITNNATVDIYVQGFVRTFFFCNFLGCTPRTLGYMIALCLNFGGGQEKKKNLWLLHRVST